MLSAGLRRALPNTRHSGFLEKCAREWRSEPGPFPHQVWGVRAVATEPGLPAQSDGGAARKEEEDRLQPFVYKGPFGKALRRVKVLSITSCTFALAACPVICILPNTLDSLAGKLGVCASLSIFGIFTTGLLHWFSSPYVHELKFHEDTKEMDVKTLTLFAQQRWNRMAVDTVKPADTWRPLATFESQGKFYYIHTDQFKHPKLLEKLAPDAHNDSKAL